MTSSKTILTIVIVNYNTKDLLEQCLKSLKKNEKRLVFDDKAINTSNEELIPAEIIIVDNASQDGSVEYLEKLKKANKFSNLSLILNKKNVGFGQANNQAMNKAKGEYIFLLNSDTIIKESAISQLLFWLSNHPEFQIAGCKLVNADSSTQPSAGYFPTVKRVFEMMFFDRMKGRMQSMYSPKKTQEVDWVMGAAMMVRKYAYQETGGFDPKIFMYMEEVEWCYRINKLGYKIAFYPFAKIHHLGGGSSKGNRTNPIVNIYRGIIYFYKKHYSLMKLAIIRLILFTKALLALIIGIIKNNKYLKETYSAAIKISVS